MTRSRLLALLAILSTLALVLVGAGCGGSDNGGGGGSADAKPLLEKAFAKKVDSGELSLDIKAELDGVDQLKGPLSLGLKGPFKSNGRKQLPDLDWKVSLEGAGQKLSGGLITTKDNAFVEFQGQAYELGSQLVKQYSSQQQSGSQPTLKSLGIDPATWLENPEVKDGGDIGGDSTRLVTGSVDVEKVVRDVFGILRSPVFRRQLQRQGQAAPKVPKLKDSDVKKIKDAIKDLKFEVNVDGNDVARRLFVEAKFDIPAGTSAGNLKGGKVSLGYTLDKVGGAPTITPPTNAKPLSQLLQQFGLGGTGLGSGLTPQQ